MSVPVGEIAANDPASYPALRGMWPASWWERLAARAVDLAVVVCWWLVAGLDGLGLAVAAVAFVVVIALLLVRAQTPGEALLGLAALDVHSGQRAGAAAFVKILGQVVLVVATLGLGLILILGTARGPLRRNVVDRATGIFLASLRPRRTGARAPRRAARDIVQSLRPRRRDDAVKRANWDGPVWTGPDGEVFFAGPAGGGAELPRSHPLTSGEVTAGKIVFAPEPLPVTARADGPGGEDPGGVAQVSPVQHPGEVRAADGEAGRAPQPVPHPAQPAPAEPGGSIARAGGAVPAGGLARSEDGAALASVELTPTGLRVRAGREAVVVSAHGLVQTVLPSDMLYVGGRASVRCGGMTLTVHITGGAPGPETPGEAAVGALPSSTVE